VLPANIPDAVGRVRAIRKALETVHGADAALLAEQVFYNKLLISLCKLGVELTRAGEMNGASEESFFGSLITIQAINTASFGTRLKVDSTVALEASRAFDQLLKELTSL